MLIVTYSKYIQMQLAILNLIKSYASIVHATQLTIVCIYSMYCSYKTDSANLTLPFYEKRECNCNDCQQVDKQPAVSTLV